MKKIKQKDIGDLYEQFLEKDILLQRAIHEIERYLYATFKYELILEEKTISLYSHQSINGLIIYNIYMR